MMQSYKHLVVVHHLVVIQVYHQVKIDRHYVVGIAFRDISHYDCQLSSKRLKLVHPHITSHKSD